MFIAAQAGHVECIPALGELGADPDKAKNGGVTPMFIAAQMGHVECIPALGELGQILTRPRTAVPPQCSSPLRWDTLSAFLR